jgi:hypothetical protein
MSTHRLGWGYRSRRRQLLCHRWLRVCPVGKRSGREAIAGSELEPGVLAKYRRLQALQARARFDPQLLDHLPARRLVCAERLRLAIAAIQREHQLTPEALLPRLLLDDRPELANQRSVLAKAQPYVAGVRPGGDAQLLQAPRLGLRKRFVREVRECRPTPQPERGLEPFACSVYVASIQRAPAILRQALEAPGIEGVVLYAELVSPGSGQQDRAGGSWNPIGLERTSQLRDEHLETAGPVLQLIAPQGIDQTLRRHDPVALDQKQSEQCPLLERREPHGPVVADNLERPQYPVPEPYGASLRPWPHRIHGCNPNGSRCQTPWLCGARVSGV